MSLHAYQFGVQIFPFMITNILKLITYNAYDTVAAIASKRVYASEASTFVKLIRYM